MLSNFGVMTVFDILLLVFGAYLLFTGLRMKKTGVVSSLIVPESEINRISRKKDFINEIYGKLMLFAGVIAAYGAYGLITDLVPGIPGADKGNIIGVFIFIVVMVWFFRSLAKVKKKYMY